MSALKLYFYFSVLNRIYYNGKDEDICLLINYL